MLKSKSEQISTITTTNENKRTSKIDSVQTTYLQFVQQTAQNVDIIHSVKNNLQCISGMLQTLTLKCKLNHIKIDSIKPICQQVNETIISLNQYLQKNQGCSILSLYSLNQLILEVLKNQQPKLSANQIELKSSLAENLPPILMDKQRIRQVLTNCLDNSREAILAKKQPDGQITISTMLAENQNLENPKLLRLLIEDNGIGLKPEQQAKFFSPFYTTKPSGNGLGTCICQAIIKMHGGFISVDGKPGLGCCICIELPLQCNKLFTSEDLYTEIANTIF